MIEKPWYLGSGEDARAERVRRGLETEAGAVLALTEWEAERERELAREDVSDPNPPEATP
jgi:hypothetical protein